MENNPFKPPEAPVADTKHGSGEFIPGGRKVLAGNAVGWISQGWEIFLESPGVWIVFFALISVLNANAENSPFASSLANLITPIFIGSAMTGCRCQEDGKNLLIGHLFSVLQKHAGRLALIGLVDMIGLFMISQGSDAVLGNIQETAWPLVIMYMLGIVALSILLTMPTCYAPALVTQHEIPPFQAMQSSFFVCIKNFAPFVIYGLLIGILVMLFTFLPHAILPDSIAWLVAFLGELTLSPMIFLSTYTSYRNIFTDSP